MLPNLATLASSGDDCGRKVPELERLFGVAAAELRSSRTFSRDELADIHIGAGHRIEYPIDAKMGSSW
jgi:hypothetical protein